METLRIKLRRSSAGQVLILVTLGYFFIVALIGAIAAVSFELINLYPWTGRLVVQLAGGFILLLVEALLIRLPDPPGRKVTRAGSPKLLAEVEAIAQLLDAPVPNEILITADFNAAAGERPRFGLFGPAHRTLYIGLPLIEALSPDGVRAIVAHELAHLSRRHGRLSLVTARVTIAWQALTLHVAMNRRYLRWAILPFSTWYLERLDSVYHGVARQNEFESDLLAAEVVGAERASAALLWLGLQNRRLSQTFWPSQYALATSQEKPPRDLLHRMTSFLRVPPSTAEVDAALTAILNERNATSETHPSLRERIESLGCATRIDACLGALQAVRVEHDWAKNLLGERRLTRLREDLESYVDGPVTTRWRELKRDLATMQSERENAEPTAEGVAAQARWIAATESPRNAINSLRELLVTRPSVEATEQLALLLLEEQTPAATREVIQLLERIKELPPRKDASNAMLKEAYLREGRTGDAEQVEALIRDQQKRMLAALGDLSVVRASDDFDAATLPAETAMRLREFFEGRADVERAFAVRKRVNQDSEKVVVFAIQRRVKWYRFESGSNATALLEAVLSRAVPLGDGESAFVTIVESRTALLRKLASTPGAVLYDRHPDRKRERAPWAAGIRIQSLARRAVFPLILLASGYWIFGTRNDRSLEPSGAAVTDPSESVLDAGVSPGTDSSVRHFLELLQQRKVDSASRYQNPLLKNAKPDSVAWAISMAGRLPKRWDRVRELVAATATRNGLARALSAYVLSTPKDSATVLVETLEELNVRFVTNVEMRSGSPQDCPSGGRRLTLLCMDRVQRWVRQR